jgi:hypothetical protein
MRAWHGVIEKLFTNILIILFFNCPSVKIFGHCWNAAVEIEAAYRAWLAGKAQFAE